MKTLSFERCPISMSSLALAFGVERPSAGCYLAIAVLALTASAESFAAELEEIVVTAQKRVESLQDVPISVTALSGEKIEKTGIQRLDELSNYVPNVVIREGLAGETISIRGFGAGENPSFEQAVSTFVDGVYFGRSKQSLASFLDLERVEVLRGPQSTFFGNNAIAGAINLTTRKPSQEFDGFVRASFNPEDSEADIYGAVGGPLSDTVSARFAAKYFDSDGYLDVFNGGTAPMKESTVARLSLLWEASDTVDVMFKIEQGQEDTLGSTSQIVDCVVGSPFTPAPSPGRENAGNGLCDLAATLTGAEFVFDEVLTQGGANPQTAIPIADSQIVPVLAQIGGEFRNLDTNNMNLTINWDIGPFTVTSVSATTGYESRRQFDVDSTPLASISTNRQEDFDQFSQELRLVSPGGESIDWLAGVYYQTNDVEFDYQTYTLVDAPDATDPGGPPGGNGVQGPVLALFAGNYREQSDSIAVFGSATFSISNAFRITTGLRYSEVDKDGDSVLFLGLTGNQAAVAVETPGAAVPFIGNPAGPNFIANSVEGAVSSDELTGQINLQYDFGDSIMGYVTLANGFKAGGFDTLIRLPETYPTGVGLCTAGDPRPPCAAVPGGIEGTSTGGSFSFDQEEVEAIEVGLKMEWTTVRLNLAVFRNEFTDLQQSIFNPTAVAFQIDNAGEATSQGIEADMQWAATDSLVITASGTLLDAQYDSFVGASCDRLSTNAGLAFCDLSGADLPFAPDWSATIGIEHTLPLQGGNLQLTSNLTAVLSDGFRTGVELDPRFELDSHELIDLQVTLGDADGRWSVGIWGRNLTDELLQGSSLYGAVRSNGPFVSTTQRPLSWGLAGTYSF